MLARGKPVFGEGVHEGALGVLPVAEALVLGAGAAAGGEAGRREQAGEGHGPAQRQPPTLAKRARQALIRLWQSRAVR